MDHAIYDFVKQNTANVSETYEFGSKLGQGKFGTVYLASHKATGQQRAIKVIKMKKVQDKPDH